MAEIIGTPTPRICTPPLIADVNGLPLYSLGPDLERYSKALGTELMPHQIEALYRGTEIDPATQMFRFDTVDIEISRQNGKSEIANKRAGFSAIVRDENALSTAQDLKTSLALWKVGMKEIELSPLDRYISKVWYGSGSQGAEFVNGGTWKISATTAGAGRGMRKIGFLGIDEAREQETWDAWAALTPTQSAADDPQCWLLSNAGSRKSIVLNAIRKRALDNMHSPDTKVGIFAWTPKPGSDIDDPQAWADANPALGRTLRESFLRGKRQTMSENDFLTEFLCTWVATTDTAINPAAWRACFYDKAFIDPAQPMVWGVDVSLDGRSTTLVACQLNAASDMATVDVLATWEGTDSASRAASELPLLLDKHKPIALGWQSNSAATVLTFALEKLRTNTRLIEIKGVDVAAVCVRLVDRIDSHRIRHHSTDLLDRQIETAEKSPRGDQYVFTRPKGTQGGVSIEAVYATGVSVEAAQRMTPSTIGFVRPTRTREAS